MYGLEKPIGDMKFVVDTRCVCVGMHAWLPLPLPLQQTARRYCMRLGLFGLAHYTSCTCSCCFLPLTPSSPHSHPCSFVAAMVTPGAGRNDIPNRLKRQFAIFHVPPPSEAAINDIFGSLMAGRFCPGTFSPEVGQGGWV